ncbi:MAG: hypothetical protein CL670_01715 [Balneola sp.]|jgi:hypothetical protein|nr:hypothetical protein [Balneola sp.]MBE77852.1 hypothetical protein [Balneola sp.]HBX66090.1 hypothetical protein [Balneolaceae bacterium]|tara:strand:+ start:45392 stop:46177 length:786 start_codon:yes stop_codon:yes gene_type:complete
MSRAIYLLPILLFFSGCLITNSFECALPFSGYERAGYFSTTPVPVQTISVGDTVFFDVDAYWSYGYECEEEYGTEPHLTTFITNSENVEFYRQENHVFMIGQRPGDFTATIVGSAYMTRNTNMDSYSVFLPINISVISEPIERGRQRVVFPPTGRIDGVQILNVDTKFPRVQLMASYSPEVEINSYRDFNAFWTLTPSLDPEIIPESKFTYNLRDHGGSDNKHYFVPDDSLREIYHGYVEVQAGGRIYGRTFTLDLSSYLN